MISPRLLLIPVLVFSQSWALIPGAWEAFSTEPNADAWTLFDYSDDTYRFVTWDDDGGGNPFIADELQGDGIWYYARSAVGGGAFTGNYATANVEAIRIDVFVGNPDLLKELDVALESGGQHYFSGSYFGSDFSSADWWKLEFDFDDPWLIYNATSMEFEEVSLTPAILSNVTELGVRFFPVGGNTSIFTMGLDNVRLIHTLVTPNLMVSSSGSTVTVSFDRLPLHEYAVELFHPATEMWSVLPNRTGIVGTDLYSFSFPEVGVELFRCIADTEATEVVSP